LSLITLKRYIAAKKIPLPPITRVGGVRVRLWAEGDIKRVREILPKIQTAGKFDIKQKRGDTIIRRSDDERALPGAINTERALTKRRLLEQANDGYD